MLDLVDGMLLRLAHIHHAQTLARPQKVALGDDTAVFSVFIEHRQRRKPRMLHPFHRLAQRIAAVDIGAHRLRRQKKEYVHMQDVPPPVHILSQMTAEGVTIL